MSILDTTRETQTRVDDEVINATPTFAPGATATATTSPATRIARDVTTSRAARFLAALRHSGFSSRDRALMAAEPAIYEEYRASLARRETAREMARGN